MTARLIIVLAIGVVFSFGCRSKKNVLTEKVQTSNDTVAKVKNMHQETLDQISRSENDFSFYQSKIKAQYKENGKGLNFDILLLMEKDNYIWMSITAVLGIEVARVMITADSVRIIDRLHKKAILTDFGYLQQMSNVPLKLEHLQRLIVGNTIFRNSVENSIIDTLLGNLAVYTNLGNQKQSTFYNNQYRPQRVVIAEQPKELKVNYELFTQTDRNVFPSKIDINIRAEKSIDCTFELSNFVFEKKREVQFNVPSGYEIVKP